MLDDHDEFLLVVHTHADLDTLGSAVGLSRALDGAARIVVPGSPTTRAQRLPAAFDIHLHDPSEVDVSAACVVVLDAPSTERVAPVPVADATGDVVLLDHHEPGNLLDVATAAYVDPEAGATATLAYRIVEALDRPLDSVAGAALAAGLLDDTGSLATARAEEFAVLGAVLTAAAGDEGAGIAALPRILERESSFGERVAATKAVIRATGYRADRTLVLTTAVSGEQTAAAHALRDAGADVALVFSDREDRIWVVGRAESGVVHLPEDVFGPLADQYGGDGGGHAGAGVAKLDADGVDEVRTRALDHLEDALDASLSPMS